jgi:hypothetical protein
MEKCSFESGKCSVECKKYSMCAYMSVQKQMSDFQEQISFIYTTLKNLLDNNEYLQSIITDLDNKVMIFTEDILNLYNDSEMKLKESFNEETD